MDLSDNTQVFSCIRIIKEKDLKKNDLVSVIIPVFNAGAYLHKSLRSIEGQTYTNIEVILIDDGSTDNSAKICRAFTDKDERFTLISSENKGAGAARNKGLEVAKGDYVYFFDADDYLEINALEKIMNIADGCDIVQFGHVKINEAGVEKGKVGYKEDIYLSDISSHKNKLALLLSQGVGFALWDKVVRINVIKDNLLQFDDKRRGQDISFIIKLYSRARTLKYVNFFPLNYRLSTSKGKKWDDAIIENHIDNYQGWRRFFEEERNDTVVSIFLSQLFLSWFVMVIPFNIASRIGVSFKRKVFLAEKMFSRIHEEHIMPRPILTRNVKQKIQKAIFRLSNGLVLILLGYTVKIVREKWLK